jgi:ATP-dependent RNA helicase DeaD
VGEEMGMTPSHIAGAILRETDLPPGKIGTIDIRARHTFVDVATEHATEIVGKLNRTKIKGHLAKAKLA